MTLPGVSGGGKEEGERGDGNCTGEPSTGGRVVLELWRFPSSCGWHVPLTGLAWSGWLDNSGAEPLDVPSAISAFPFAPFHEKPRARQCSWELLSVSKYLSRPEKRCAPISLDFFFFVVFLLEGLL